jgi:hypothetical protein
VYTGAFPVLLHDLDLGRGLIKLLTLSMIVTSISDSQAPIDTLISVLGLTFLDPYKNINILL